MEKLFLNFDKGAIWGNRKQNCVNILSENEACILNDKA